MKPNWKDAPEWAKYLAMDSDGEWYWYEFTPGLGRGSWTNRGSRMERAAPSVESWRRTLEERPNT